MRRYILRRLAIIPLVLVGMTFLTFVTSQLVPRDPVAAFLGSRTEGGPEQEQTIARLKEKWGWDKSLPERYWRYVTNLVQGELGRSSSSRRPVSQDLADYTPATLELVFVTMCVLIVVGLAVGLLGALLRGRRGEGLYIALTVLIISAPAFWIGIMASRLLYRDLGWLPGTGRIDLFITEPTRRTGFLLIDSLIAGNWAAFVSALHHLILPAGLLGILLGVWIGRVLRTELKGVLTEDYIRTARGKGLSGRVVLLRHALRNAIVPVITLSGLAFGALLTSTIVVENIFGWPGLGNYVFKAATKLDLPGISGVVLIVGGLYLIVNLLVDVLYAVADPRVRLR